MNADLSFKRHNCDTKLQVGQRPMLRAHQLIISISIRFQWVINQSAVSRGKFDKMNGMT